MADDRNDLDDLDDLGDLDEVPKLPRGSFIKFLRWGDVVRILMLATFLVAIIVLRKPCAEGTANFVKSFEAPIDAGPAPKPVDAGMKLIRLTGDESEAELRKKLGREKADAGAEQTPANKAAPKPKSPKPKSPKPKAPKPAPPKAPAPAPK